FVQLGTSQDDDIVLDFFGGSGTTAEAVLRQNMIDRKKRRFIFITLPEKINQTTQAGKNAKSLGCETIADVARLRILKAIEKINKESLAVANGADRMKDSGFKYFTATPSHFKKWQESKIKK
ncbi:MAG: DNA methyltransferase, partial [Cyclobacteriaceae bacterium]